MSHENMSHEKKSYENMSFENRFYEKMSYVQPHCSLTTSETPELDLVVTGSTSLNSSLTPKISILVLAPKMHISEPSRN